MFGEVDYASKVLSTLFEAVGRVLPAGLGLTGFALGYACRDALSNLLAGVLIILYQPFKTGRAESINFRYTVLDSEGKTVLAPNSAVFGSVITVE